MTIDEAIERYTNNAEYERTHGSLQSCLEFRQLMEWLKDYKQLKSQQHNRQSDRNTKEIIEIMQSDVDAETKCKMISSILNAKPHYFELDHDEFESITPEEMQKCKDIVKKYTSKQKTGYWISMNTGKPSHIKDRMTTESVKCSKCDEWLTASDEYACNGSYCPNCGIKMIELQESENKNGNML